MIMIKHQYLPVIEFKVLEEMSIRILLIQGNLQTCIYPIINYLVRYPTLG